MTASQKLTSVWPSTATRTTNGTLAIGGVEVPDLVEEFGSPLYVFDEATIRERCRAFKQGLASAYPHSRVTYAGKAWLSRAILEVVLDEGLSVDVVSGGELHVALAAGVPAESITLHGNSKTPEELSEALEAGIGRLVIDNFDEIRVLGNLTSASEKTVDVLLRLNPGIDVHTHDYRKTGIVDSKFGLGVQSGDAERAVATICKHDGLNLIGFHAHVGSQIFESEPFIDTVDALFQFAAEMRERHDVQVTEISPGGGFGIAYLESEPALDPESYAQIVGQACREAAERYGFDYPEVTIEPGRSIIGPAGVAVYRLLSRKEIPGVRTYVSVDGGMADNIRPALYEAIYTAELVTERHAGPRESVTVAGKYCESGDVLIEHVELPPFEYGDLIAIPAAGAYCLAMASNYNMSLRPAAVFVTEGESRLVQRRETYDDLMRRDF